MSTSAAEDTQIQPENYRYLQDFIYRESGIVLEAEKQYLLDARLLGLAREEGVKTLNDLCALLRAAQRPQLKQKVVDAMTTNETYFMRETAHYDALRTTIIPELLKIRSDTRRLRFWSAASSTGQEAFSLGMMLLDMGLSDWNIEILGTDLCTRVLERARGASFSQLEMNRGLPSTYLLKYFRRAGLQWELKDEVKRMAKFQAFDLRGSMRALGPFDAVFCRNVLIYFDLPTKSKIVEEIHGTLFRGGHLFLGSTETSLPVSSNFERKSIGDATVYEAK
ncbi:MAG: protein-glutamate O-methyltransferase CheR [Acidobacteriota bacterium]